jgi:hypothetical protein
VAPATNTISAASATSWTGQFGEAMPVAVLVKSPSGDPVPSASVSFVASDGGGVDVASAQTDATGLAKVRWRLGAVAKTQTLVASVGGGQSVTFSGTATTNAWAVGTLFTDVKYAWRLADEGSLAGEGPNWAATELGSPPMLWIVCNGGFDVVITHPKMQTTNGNVSRQIDQEPRVAEFWNPVTPSYDKLYAPSLADPAQTRDFVKKLEAAKQLNVAYRSGAANTLIAPTFGTVGLSLILPQIMGQCGPWP